MRPRWSLAPKAWAASRPRAGRPPSSGWPLAHRGTPPVDRRPPRRGRWRWRRRGPRPTGSASAGRRRAARSAHRGGNGAMALAGKVHVGTLTRAPGAGRARRRRARGRGGRRDREDDGGSRGTPASSSRGRRPGPEVSHPLRRTLTTARCRPGDAGIGEADARRRLRRFPIVMRPSAYRTGSVPLARGARSSTGRARSATALRTPPENRR